MNCSIRGCGNTPEYNAGLLIRKKADGPLIAKTGIRYYLCSEHKDVPMEDLFTSFEWADIKTSFKARGKGTPSIKHTKLYKEPITKRDG